MGKWNQPAGWIDVGENPIDAVVREVKEETGYDFVPTKVLGGYSLFRRRPDGDKHALKIIFTGKIGNAQSALAEASSETKRFTPDEIYRLVPETFRNLCI